MKAYKGFGFIAPPVCNLGTSWRWEVNLTEWQVYLGKSFLTHWIEGPDGLQRPSGPSAEEKCLFSLPGFEPRIVQPAAQLLDRLVSFVNMQ